MTRKKFPLSIIDKKSTYGKKATVVITSQGTPEHNKDSKYTMSAHDQAELFIAKMHAERLEQIKQDKPTKEKSKIQKIKKKIRGVKK